MDRVIGILLGCVISVYVYFVSGRLWRYYSEALSWNPFPPYSIIARGLASLAAGAACIEIWSTAAMAVLHFAACFLVTDAVNAALRLFRVKQSYRRQRLYACGLLPVLLFICLMVYGAININRIVQTNYTISTEKPIRAEGYRIAFLSDVHYGTVQAQSVLQSSIERINAQNPDVVILGGDIVEEGTAKADMQEVFRALGGLEASYGIYFVYGNHDRQADGTARTYSDAELAAAIEESGIIILEDEATQIQDDFLLVGRDDASWETNSDRKEIGDLLGKSPNNSFVLVIDHQPLDIEKANDEGVDLLLSGHTHAGQIFPVGYLIELMGGLSYGLYTNGACKTIVSSGFAGWGYSIRTQAHCEYVIIDLLPA